MNDMLTSNHVSAELFEPLLALTGSNLYAGNAFRLLEVSVEASARELARRQELVRHAARAGVHVPPGSCQILPREPGPDEQEIRETAHAVQDAEHRLAHEFFWFWPLKAGGGARDPALQYLVQGQIEEALALWRDVRSNPSEAAIAKHNLAVFHHFSALQYEQRLLAGNSGNQPSDIRNFEPKAGTDWRVAMKSHWGAATKYWEAVAADEHFWDQVLARIRAIGDASLGTGVARQMRYTLPTVLALINARLAIEAKEHDRLPDAQRHVTLIRESKLDRERVDQGLRLAIQPQCALIKLLCGPAIQLARADPEHADAVVENVLTQTGRPLAVIDLLLAEDHLMRAAEHDRVADTALSCQIAFGNKTKNHKRCLELIDQIVPIAVSNTIREKVAQNREIDLRNVEDGLCWFCGKNPSDRPYEIAMHGEVQHMFASIQWRHMKVNVPRCKFCSNDQELSVGFAALAWISLGLAVFGPSQMGALAFVAGLLGCLLFCLARILVPRHRRKKQGRPLKLREQNEYPAVKALVAKGWAMGEKPAAAGQ